MNTFKRLSAGRQVLFTFGTLCAILLIIGALSFFSLRSIERSNQRQLRATGELALIDDTAQDIGQMQAEVLREVLSSDVGEIKRLDQSVLDIEQINAKELADYQKIVDTKEEKQLYDKVMQARKTYWEHTQPVLVLGLTNLDAEATEFINSTQAPAYDELLKAVNNLIQYVEADANNTADATTHFISEIKIIGDILIGLTILITIGTAFAVAGVGRRLKKDNRLLQIEVTERKHAEELLRLLNSAVEQSKESILITDAELDLPGPKIIFVNPAFTQMTGYTAAEVIGKTPRILQGARTDRIVLSRLRQNLQRGEFFEGETINYRKDGTGFNLEWQIAPLRNADEKITHYVAIQRDITARKQIEDALKEAQALYHSLVDQMPAGVFRKNAEGRFVFVNSWYCQIKGMTPEQILGKTPRELAAGEFLKHPEAAKEIQLAIRGANHHELIMETGQRIDVDELYPGVDGTMQHWQVVKSPVFGLDGKITGTQGIFFDVTKRDQAEAALAQERNLLRTMIDNSPDAIHIKDLSGRKTLANPAELKNMGCKTEAEAIGKSDFDIYPQELAAEYFTHDQAVIQSGQPLINHEEKIITPGGETHWSLSSKIPLCDAAGNIIGLVGMGRDVTERKRFEAQLLQSQKMETVGKLAGGIAHEFNSILTAIIGQSELLLGDLPTGSPLVNNATEINKAAGRAATLTRQLLAYGRKQFLQPEALDLNRVIAGMEGMFHHLMGGSVDAQIVPALDLHAVMADAGQIEQVIMNMIINARDAMPNGGKLMLETANVSFDEESVGRYPELKPGNYVMLAITDTGPGMTEAVKARMFEPFFSTKDVGQGTGLGLSTCYGIIKQSGGHISVYSAPGRGTTFKIYLPQIERQKKIPVQRLDSPDLPRGTETILLVEDDPALREMAATLLRRLGYTVLAAANGIEALSVKQERRTGHIDLLFTDVVMPHMSGKELADRVRALYPHTKILFTSAYTENAAVHQGVLNPGVALLQKPFTPRALAHKLREVLD